MKIHCPKWIVTEVHNRSYRNQGTWVRWARINETAQRRWCYGTVFKFQWREGSIFEWSGAWLAASLTTLVIGLKSRSPQDCAPFGGFMGDLYPFLFQCLGSPAFLGSGPALRLQCSSFQSHSNAVWFHCPISLVLALWLPCIRALGIYTGCSGIIQDNLPMSRILITSAESLFATSGKNIQKFWG